MLLPVGVVDCLQEKNRQNCSTGCVTESWFSKITDGFVNAEQICVDQGYNGTIGEYGSNSGVQCKYPGNLIGKPNFAGGSLRRFGENVIWKCNGYGMPNLNL